MKNDTRTSDEIERDIVDERAQMSDTINNLQKKFSVDTIVNDLGHMISTQGSDIGRSISQTVGRNPTAVALVGVGLAWLFVSQARRPSANATERQSDHTSGRRRDLPASAHPGTQERSTKGPFSEDDRYWYGNGHSPRDSRGQGRSENGVMSTIRNSGSAVGHAVSDAADSLGHAASNMTERLSDGLENLSDDAKARVVSARRAAHEARLSSEAAMHRGSRAATDFFQDQPLVVGALAVAVGAAIGGMLPHSRIEDDTMGESSDRLFEDAQAVFREERDKAMATLKSAAKDVKGEVKDVASDLTDKLPEGKNVGDAIVDRASDAVTRVYDRATDKAEHTGSNRPKT